MRLPAALVACAGLAGAAARAEPIDPKIALLAGAEAYAAPFAERMRIHVGAQPWEGRSEWAVVRCDPGRREVRLDLGPMEIWLGDGRMVAVRRDNPRDCFLGRYEPPLTLETLWSLLPPVPAPGLALALDEDLALAPYARVAAWTGADLAPSGRVTLTGVLVDGGEITVHMERSGRIGDVVAQLAEDRWLSIQIGPGPALEPEQWRPEVEGRREVASLAALAPPAPPLRAGDVAPELFFLDADNQPWRLSAQLEQQQAPVVVIMATAADGQAMEAGLGAAGRLAAREDLTIFSALVYTLEAWTAESVRADAARFGSAGVNGRLWSVSPDETIDLVTLEPAAALVVGADGVVRAVIPLLGREGDAIEEALDAALGEQP
ncbi:MAG: hypothetical protein ACF8R7_11475 [Phycisphaerales bacterium JB039]